MPITLGVSRSTNSPLQLMVIKNSCFVGFHYLWPSACFALGTRTEITQIAINICNKPPNNTTQWYKAVGNCSLKKARTTVPHGGSCACHPLRIKYLSRHSES